MTDARLKEYLSLEVCTMDLLMLDTGRLDESQELATAGRVALGTDALASTADVLPDLDSTDRRGWWGDFEAEEIWGGWPIGCKNWLLLRAKITDAPSLEGSTVERARRYTQEALQPFIDKRIASQTAVEAVRTELQRIDVTAQIYRGPEQDVDLRYQALWQDDAVDTASAAVTNSRTFSLNFNTGSPAFGTPVFVTKTPIHLPSQSFAVSSPVFALRALGPARLVASALTMSSPAIGQPLYSHFG